MKPIYVLCFLTHADDVLMLHRNRPPNQGKWNGVGGRIEPGESPRQACLREVAEETGYTLDSVHFAGLLTWEGFEIPPGGLYIFTAPAPLGKPVASDEGTLEWKPRGWVFTSPDVVDNLHIVCPLVFNGAEPQIYHFVYHDGKMLSHTITPVPPKISVDII